MTDRKHSADAYSDIRSRQEELFGRKKVGEVIPSPTPYRALTPMGTAKQPCYCAIEKRTECIKDSYLATNWFFCAKENDV